MYKYIYIYIYLYIYIHISLQCFARIFGGVFELDAIFLAIVKNSVAQEVNLAVLVKLIALCCEDSRQDC